MKKFIAVSLLAAATVAGAPSAFAWQASSDSAQAGGQAGGQQQVVIKDQAEYQAYSSASQQTDPAAKAQALEAFLQQYPNTVVKKEALELLLAAYQQANNPPKLLDAAQRLLQVDPNNTQAAIVVAYVKMQQAQQAQAQNAQNPKAAAPQFQDAAKAAQTALQGLDKLQKPANIDQAAFDQQKNQIATAMNATIGFANYLSDNYDAAIEPLVKAISLNPNDVADMEYLGISLAKPVTRQMMYADPQAKQRLLEGVFWLSKAAASAPAQAKANFTQVAQYYYNRYHGGSDGFDQAVQQASGAPNPTNFQVVPVPSPQEQAAKVLASTPPDQILTQDGFDTWSSILQVAAPADAQKVWDATKGKKLQLQGTVVSADPNTIQLAVSDQAVQDKRPDVIVKLAKPMTTPPAAGADSYPVVGVADSYTPQPFQLTLANGASNVKPAAPAKRTPARRSTRRRTTASH
ncbi:MAG TPA: hypothetical protein VGC88_06990 [Terriglobales bacterium]